jgi:hypothetical protein
MADVVGVACIELCPQLSCATAVACRILYSRPFHSTPLLSQMAQVRQRKQSHTHPYPIVQQQQQRQQQHRQQK